LVQFVTKVQVILQLALNKSQRLLEFFVPSIQIILNNI
jgi:hypothetical protein